MRRLVFALYLLLICACLQARGYCVPADSVRSLCEYMVRVYPAANLQDLYKTCYQDFFGAGHMVTDSASAMQYIRYEVEELKANGRPATGEKIVDESTGFRHRFVRLDLRRVVQGEISEEEVLRRFIEVANTAKPVHEDWPGEWAQIETIALQVHPAWANAELQAALREAAQANRAVHQSEAYRNTYHPHYRLTKL